MVSRSIALYFIQRHFFSTKTAVENIFVRSSSSKLKARMSKSLFKSSSFICMSTSSSGSPESISTVEQEKRKQLDQWLEHCKCNGIDIPENITEQNFQHLLDLGYYQRLSFLNYLVVTEYKNKRDVEKKEKLKERRKKEKEELAKLQPGHIKYGLWSNSMFAKVHKQFVINFYNHRLASAARCKQSLILDIGFGEHMKSRASKSLANQLMLSITCNRENRDPFNLALCNVDFNSESFIHLKKILPSIEDLPMNIFTEHYLDLYPKEKLIYLTPNAKDTMTSFDSEAIYIIGGMVDHGVALPLTLAKAKAEKIKMQKFPLDRYHVFKGQKSLAVHVVVAILLDLQNTGDWKKSLENIPRRLLQTATPHHNRWDLRKRQPKFQQPYNLEDA